MADDLAPQAQQPNLEAYVRVNKKREDAPAAENEIRVQASGKLRQYISYALALLQEKGQRTVLLKGMGRAINKAVAIAEIVKRRVAGLHQVTDMGSMALTDVYEPKQEGLERLEVNRNVSIVTITLSLDELDTTLPGYQAPLPPDQIQPEVPPGDLESRPRRSGGRSRARGRGGKGGAPATEGEQPAGDDANGTAAAPGGGRGRRRYRGRNRGAGAAAGGEGAAANGDAAAGEGAAAGGEGRPRNRGNRRGRGRGRGGAGAAGAEGAAPAAEAATN